MSKTNEINKARTLLGQALFAINASEASQRIVQETRNHIKKAMSNLDEMAKHREQKKQSSQNQFENWWGNITSGTVTASSTPFSPEAHSRSLEALDAMINRERQALEELEKTPDPPDSFDGLLNG